MPMELKGCDVKYGQGRPHMKVTSKLKAIRYECQEVGRGSNPDTLSNCSRKPGL